MGKWTPEYVDDVLHYKLKNLVQGAIKRSALEKTGPTISYENFVDDLDIGDSFTTSLIDILVKELAERRTRPCQSDKRLIADRSAKSLRLLATPLRIYHGRSMGRTHPSRRTATLSDYLSIPPVEMDTEEDEDIFENVLDNPSTIEGVRTNADLYDAYVNQNPIFRGQSPSPSGDDAQPSTSSQTDPTRTVPWSMSSTSTAPATSLNRQPSIRRPARSRTVDFNEFSLRRRSVARSIARENQLREFRGIEGEDAAEVPGWRTSNPPAARRFFPFIRNRRHESSDSPWGPEPQTSTANEDQDRIWFDVSPAHLELDELAAATVSDERARSMTPRLRRGGLRAPESILSRHASPVVVSVAPPDGPLALPSPPRHAPEDPGVVSEPTSYPTPSAEHDP